MQLTYQFGEEQVMLTVEADGAYWRARLPDGTEHRFQAERRPNDVLQIAEQDRVFRVPFARIEKGVAFSLAGATYRFTPPTTRASAAKGSSASGTLTAPMVGVVVDVLVTEGQTVEAYQPLAVVEAMKVMATLEAPFPGTVRKVSVKKGQRVAHGETVIEVEAS